MLNIDDYLEPHPSSPLGLSFIKEDKVDELRALLLLAGAERDEEDGDIRYKGEWIALTSNESPGRWFTNRKRFIKVAGGILCTK